jgi:hypothetical protein
MSFELYSAPTTFQVFMDKVFGKHLTKFVMVFFDDILIYPRIFTEHIEHLGIVLNKLAMLSPPNPHLGSRGRNLLSTGCGLGDESQVGFTITKQLDSFV